MAMTVDELVAAARDRVDRLDPVQAAEAAGEGGAAIIDVRPESQRRRDGEIPGSYVAPRNAVEWRLCEETGWRDPRLPDRDGQPIILCAHGCQSSLLASTLVDLGFARAADVIGGFDGWRDAGLPVVPFGDPSVNLVVPGGPGSPLEHIDPYA